MKMYCDRCREQFEGSYDEHMTAGYYAMAAWEEMRQSPDEQIVCDGCMFKDPKYIKIYGRHS